MRPTFMGFETATRGLMTNQKALDIVGNNLSNIGVTGYTRQRVDLVSLSVNMRNTRYNQNMSSFAGQGVNVYGVSQIRNSYLDKRFREEYADVGYYGVTSSVLGELSSALDEIEPSNMTRVMSRFYESWNEMLNKTTTESTGAANLHAVATQIVQVFQQMSAKIDNVWNQQEYNLKLEVDNVNSIMERIAQLNDEIAKQGFNSMDVENELYQPLELLDQRNVLLDELSQYGNIYYETGSDGQVTVWMGTKSDTNPPIIEGDTAQKLAMSTNDSDPDFKTVTVYWNDTGAEWNLDSGSITGALEMLNGRGIHANGLLGESYSQGIHYYKEKINEFARTFMDSFNHVVEIAVPDTEPPAGYDPPRYKVLFEFNGDEKAANLAISSEWAADTDYLITNIKDKISATGDNDNTYAAKAALLFETELDFGEFKGTINDYIIFYSNTKLANDKDFADSRLEAVTSVADTLLNQIQQISGVSMEEEGVDMMMYQKAYDAMSRVFTTLDEMLDKLINSTGVVGR